VQAESYVHVHLFYDCEIVYPLTVSLSAKNLTNVVINKRNDFLSHIRENVNVNLHLNIFNANF
jgi:hypothetical protein